MGDVLAELENMLRSKPAKDRITAKEELVLLACKAKAIRDFTIGACASSAVVWIATKRFTHGQRFNTSVGSAMIAGMWKFNRTLNSCVDQILGLQGSRLQLELAFIILAKHQQDESRMNLVRKYFYPEEVFSDTKPDSPFFRWRYRNMYFDNSAHERTEEYKDESCEEKSDEQKRVQSTSTGGGDMTADTFDILFGHEDGKDIALDDNIISRRRLRKRGRRHHSRHSEITFNETEN
ncbi:uncharacterized protein M6B38_279460 [Iris pallida]|uniref:Uncharacterized protein n=1 Tax=Iris pallida TaxID=29817 RepID=A0AAX6HZW9_IRIPA|nr:uncharacterized protein M6B38_165955 [Iris pallida]KAJ6846261.1 uncharacterized protein M6B38_279460 [Iris pallida]